MEKTFEEEILEADMALSAFRERIRTDHEFGKEIEELKKFLFADL